MRTHSGEEIGECEGENCGEKICHGDGTAGSDFAVAEREDFGRVDGWDRTHAGAVEEAEDVDEGGGEEGEVLFMRRIGGRSGGRGGRREAESETGACECESHQRKSVQQKRSATESVHGENCGQGSEEIAEAENGRGEFGCKGGEVG